MALSTWNEVSINPKFVSAAKKGQFVGLARRIAQAQFAEAKNELIRDIEEHEVSKELAQGTENDPSSSLISDGSLRAFIGFYPEDTPVENLKKYFNENTKMGSDARISDNGKNKIFYEFKVSVPSMNQLNNEKLFETPGNWRSSSWISIIEDGTSTAVHFVMAKLSKTADKFAEAGSRSEWGLQRDNINTGRDFSPQPYISEIIKDFLDKFKE